MSRLELFSRIQKLAAIVHSEDLGQYNLTEESIKEMRRVLDELTEEFATQYC